MAGKYLVRLEDLMRKGGGGEPSTSSFSPDEEIKEEKYEIPEESEEPVLPVSDDGNGINNDGVGGRRIILLRKVQVIRVVVNTDEPKTRNQTETHRIRRKPVEETRKEEPTTRVLRPIKPKPVPPGEEEESVKTPPLSKPPEKLLGNHSEDSEEVKELQRSRKRVLTPEQKRAGVERQRNRRQMLRLAAAAAREKGEGKVDQVSAAEIEQYKRRQERNALRNREKRALNPLTPEQKKANAERVRFKRKMLKLANATAREKREVGQVSAVEIKQYKRSQERAALRNREKRALLKLAAVAKIELQNGGLEDPTKLIKSFKNTELEALRAEFERRRLAPAKQEDTLEIEEEEEAAMALVKSMPKDEVDRLNEEYERIKVKNRERARTKRMEINKLKKKDNLPKMTREEYQLERWYTAALARRRKMSPEQLAQPDPKFDELESTRFKAKELRRQRKYNLPEMTEEERKKWIEEEKEKAEQNRAMKLKRQENMTDEEKEQLRIKNYMHRANRSAYYKLPDDVKESRIAWGRQWRYSLTGEKLERHRDSVRRAVKKQEEKIKQDPERYQKFKDKMNMRLRKKTQNETVEERQKRLLRYRLYQSRKLMRNKLKEEGLPEEEIQARVQEYTENYYMEHPITRPGPKGNRRKTVGSGGGGYHSGLSHLPVLSTIYSRVVSTVSASTCSTEMTTTSLPPHVTYGEAYDDEDDTDALDNNVEEETSVQQSFAVASPASSFDDHGPLDDPLREDDFDDDDADENEIRDNNLVADPNPLEEHEHEGHVFKSTHQAQVQKIAKDLPDVPPETGEDEGIRVDDADADEPPSNSQRHKRKRAISKMCEDCGKVFKYHSSYITHMRQVHLDPRKCPHPKCDFLYREGPQLWAHFRDIHVQSEVAVKCADADKSKPKPKSRTCPHANCDFLFNNRKHLLTHFRHVHLKDGVAPASLNPTVIENGLNSTKARPQSKSKEPSMCPECGKTFKKKCTLDDHIRRFHEGKGFFCDICDNGSDLQSVAKLWRHKVVKHGMSDLEPPPNIEVITCEFCGEKILRGYTQHVLKKHPEMKDRLPASASPAMGGTTTPGVVKCPECSKEIGKYQLARHLAWIHGVGEQKRFPCTNCGIKFKHRNHMEQHLPSCLNGDKAGSEDPTSNSNDQEHVSETGMPLPDPGLHTTCHVCSKTLRVESLTAHLRRIHGIGRQASCPCPYCGKCFMENWSMNFHAVGCHAISNMVTELGLNNYSRTRRRPFLCVLCGGKFSKRKDLREHVVATHPKEYESLENPDLSKIPLECKDCSESFSDLDEVREHLESYHPEKSLKCPECEKVMLSSVELALHVSLGHNKKREAKLKRLKANRKTIASSLRRKSSAGGRLGRRRRGRKRRVEGSDDESDDDQLQKVVVRTPTLSLRRSLRNRGSERNLSSVITPPCFVRLKRMSNEEIVSYLFRKIADQ